ncbi:MAG TPA: Gfo/Idh/MocA family oxidoreductase [Tepidisphaeraceae bacterium]|nr:Gfo/Idh/MocA family oxidoreductase [Tepidisphaeraceae bacterium]
MRPANGPRRRDVIKTTAALSVAAVMSSLGSNFAHAARSDVLKVGVIGCGGRGTGAARDCAKASPRTRIVAMGDLFKDRLDSSRNNLNELGEQFQVTDDRAFVGFDAYKQVIDSDVDYVLLCEPPGFRPRSVAYAVEKGRHVFAEKPIAVDSAGVRRFLAAMEAAKSKQLGVLAGTVFRHHTPHIDAIKQLHDGVIGDIVAGYSYYNTAGLWHHPRKPEWSDMEWQVRNWLYFNWLSGDHIVEQNVHRIDIQNWVMKGPPKSAYAMGGRQARVDPMYGHIYDHFAVEYVYENDQKQDVRIINTCRQQDGTDTRVTEYYVGTKGTAEPSKGPKSERRVRPLPLAEGYIQEHRDLIKSLEEGRPLNEGQLVADCTLASIMGRMSAYTGKLITWDQALTAEEDTFPKELGFGEMPVPPVAVPGKA